MQRDDPQMVRAGRPRCAPLKFLSPRFFVGEQVGANRRAQTL
jgi:hypothetical protein